MRCKARRKGWMNGYHGSLYKVIICIGIAVHLILRHKVPHSLLVLYAWGQMFNSWILHWLSRICQWIKQEFCPLLLSSEVYLGQAAFFPANVFVLFFFSFFLSNVLRVFWILEAETLHCVIQSSWFLFFSKSSMLRCTGLLGYEAFESKRRKYW